MNADAVAVSFEMEAGRAVYASWTEMEDGGYWRVVGDFTGGEAAGGGRCELTGDREVSRFHFDFLNLS